MRLRGPIILQQGQVWEERGSDAKDDEDDGGGDGKYEKIKALRRTVGSGGKK